MQRTLRSFDTIKQNITTPNMWDIISLLLILGFVWSLSWLAKQIAVPYHLGEHIPITLDPQMLPIYAMRTVSRMVIALFFSFLFTFIFGTLAAKNDHAGKIIIPMIDILQSVPVLGFLSLTIAGFIALFPGSMLGPECASIFAIFTGQAWNMTLSLYQSLRTVPEDLKEAASVFQLSAWQRFWRIEVPFSVPGLLWNTMMSMSGSWFFVVASEAISVSNQTITLPGIGSYIDLAIKYGNYPAIAYAIITMLIVIMLYDQLVFRPLICWSEKFKPIQDTPQEAPSSWVIDLLQRTRLIKLFGAVFSTLANAFTNIGAHRAKIKVAPDDNANTRSEIFVVIWNTIVIGLTIFVAAELVAFIYDSLTFAQIKYVFFLGWLTGLRVFILILLCSLVWIPVGVWIGMNSRVTQMAQPIVQFLASFPANLFYPVVVYFIVHYELNPEIWLTPLMILGAQWYILFNVIAGASALPKDLYFATANLGVKGWLWWRRFILPGIFPYYITGAITAAGGAWNASIIAELVSWKGTTLHATGLGAYITHYTDIGAFPQIALGISVMCFYVLLLNRIIWRPLYKLAETRFQI